MKKLLLMAFAVVLTACAKNKETKPQAKLLLMPDQGKMHCNVVLKDDEQKNVFALTIPETIGSKEGMILNFPSTNIIWEGPDDHGIVRTSWTTEGAISYELVLTPDYDFVDAKMTITNLTDRVWNDVWSFNCLNPTRAIAYKDTLMQRTYMSDENGPKLLSETKRIKGPRPTIGVYFSDGAEDPEGYPFVRDFQATSPHRTNGNYLVTLAESGDSYMAATSPESLFLFNNLKYKCIHSIPNFGVIAPGRSKTVTSRFYFAKGNLESFVDRYNKEIVN